MSNSKYLSLASCLYEAKLHFIRLPIVISLENKTPLLLPPSPLDITIVSDDLALSPRFSWSKASSFLGQELGHLILDCREKIDVEKLCALAGSVKGGHLFIMIINADFPALSFFHQRLYRFLKAPSVTWLSSNRLFELNEKVMEKTQKRVMLNAVPLPTEDQLNAMEGIYRVLFGHRKRPALLLANRGRGKSSAMGLAVANIVKEHKKQIIVTSPTIANVQMLFQHADVPTLTKYRDKYSITYANGSKLQFIAMDTLLNTHPLCDLLLVDEAAAIPLPLLTRCLSLYSRIVFSSTEHGYEGTGRGFSHVFRKLLNEKAKGWNEYCFISPIRYANNDPLETWLFSAFLFDAEPKIKPRASLRINRDTHYNLIEKHQLLNNECLLKQVFALLVSSHYQTSPNELMQLLNDEQKFLVGAFYNNDLVGVLLANIEGGFPSTLANDVVQGKRRLKGHLLAQSLAAHTGDLTPLVLRVLRVSRIAVFQDYRRLSIGRNLLKRIEKHASDLGFDFIGSSFGVTPSLLSFWLANGYKPLRLGVNRDAASGTYSLQLGKLFNKTALQLDGFIDLFYANFLAQLSEQFMDLSPVVVQKLLFGAMVRKPLTSFQFQQIKQYSQGALGYDLMIGSLQAWVCYCLCSSILAIHQHPFTSLVIEKILQRHSWANVASQHQLTGRKQVETKCREWVAETLLHLDA